MGNAQFLQYCLQSGNQTRTSKIRFGDIDQSRDIRILILHRHGAIVIKYQGSVAVYDQSAGGSP
jgi:hypothetical protein